MLLLRKIPRDEFLVIAIIQRRRKLYILGPVTPKRGRTSY